MKYIFLTGSLVFGIAGISQAMDAFLGDGLKLLAKAPVVFNFQYISVSFQPAPGFVRIFILSFGLFCLFLIWRKLKLIGFDKIWNYS